jgi:ppGpp synthetase/RelA/SpoT-type nucleotidyltranferase
MVTGLAQDSESLARAIDALDIVELWRAAHARPLGAATMGLRSRVDTMGCSQIEVSQRLKRLPTVIDKLRREPGMNLGRMADFGGCRAVLRDLDEVRRVQGRYADDGVFVRMKDYIEQPKPDGYRAVHVIVRYHGRLIEVQLRTQVQHEWAYTVESVTSRFGLDIKSGGGPEPVRDWFAAVSEAMALEEQGDPVSPELLHRVSTLRRSAQPHLQGVRR